MNQGIFKYYIPPFFSRGIEEVADIHLVNRKTYKWPGREGKGRAGEAEALANKSFTHT